MSSAFNQDTSIFTDNDNTLKQNVGGQKPYKYFTQDFGQAPSDGGNLAVGSRGVRGAVERSVPAPTRLNEVSTGYKFPINAAYLGREYTNQKEVDTSSDLRWGGNIRCHKSQQLVTEESYRRTDFYAPKTNTESEKPFIAVDLNILRGDGIVIPNFSVSGNNAIDVRAKATRTDRLIVNSHHQI